MSARPMKDTGIPWLGQIPAEWEVAQLRRLVELAERGVEQETDSRQPRITHGISAP